MRISFGKQRLSAILLLCSVVLLLGGGGYASIKILRPQWLNASEIASHPATTPAIGFVDKLGEDAVGGKRISVVGWALSKAGVSPLKLIFYLNP